MPTHLQAKIAKAIENARSAARPDGADAVIVVDVDDAELEQFEVLASASHDRGPWAARVLDDEQSTEAVVAMISNDVDQRAKARETQRSTRFGIGVSLAAVSAAAIFAIVGWLFNKGLLEMIEQKIATIREEIPIKVEAAVEGIEEEMDVAIASRVDRELGVRVPTEVAKQIELEQLLLQATILSVQFDLGTQYTNDDRDRMMQLFERFADEPSITARPDFDAILFKSIDAFASANNEYQVDRLVELYPEKCFALEPVAFIVMEHYGRRLAGSELHPDDWPVTLTTTFERAYHAVPDTAEGLKIGLRLLVAARASDTAASDALIESSLALDPAGAELLLRYVLGSTHWALIAKQKTRAVSTRARMTREMIGMYRDELDALTRTVGAGTVAEIVTTLFVEARREGQSPHDLREAADMLLQSFDGHEELEAAVTFLKQSVL